MRSKWDYVVLASVLLLSGLVSMVIYSFANPPTRWTSEGTCKGELWQLFPEGTPYKTVEDWLEEQRANFSYYSFREKAGNGQIHSSIFNGRGQPSEMYNDVMQVSFYFDPQGRLNRMHVKRHRASPQSFRLSN
jgi:hypothetical protein